MKVLCFLLLVVSGWIMEIAILAMFSMAAVNSLIRTWLIIIVKGNALQVTQVM